jgi:hypothetical protein
MQLVPPFTYWGWFSEPKLVYINEIKLKSVLQCKQEILIIEI